MIRPLYPLKEETVNISRSVYRAMIEDAWEKNLIPILVSKHQYANQLLLLLFNIDTQKHQMKTDIMRAERMREDSDIISLDPMASVDITPNDITVIDGLYEYNSRIADLIIKAAHQVSRLIILVESTQELDGIKCFEDNVHVIIPINHHAVRGCMTSQ
ncbi:hypothetical protein ACPV5G_18215 [Photobacterium damselae]|uniref:hypothetical protein n=1 Tax=Photobacterium damselae TaxID=38293 RepID=UPI004068CC22